MLQLVLTMAALGAIPAAIAGHKGRTAALWWVYGALLFPLALVHAGMARRNLSVLDLRRAQEGMRRCSDCAEMVRPQARLCRYCGSELQVQPMPQGEPSKAAASPQVGALASTPLWFVLAVAALLAAVVTLMYLAG